MGKMIKNWPVFVVVHNIRSLYNVGAIFRTADAFGVKKLFLTGYTGCPPDPKISKVALGAEQVILWEKKRSVDSVIKALKKDYSNLMVVGLENNVKTKVPMMVIQDFRVKAPVLLILGEEVSGIPKSVLNKCDVLLEIPMFGVKESLNVSVAFGVVAFYLTCLGK
jgi:tRNA G18 (ribose-2'-O)-methylase SpoU